MGSDTILRVSNIRKQAKEIIITKVKNPGRLETHTNAYTNNINHATKDMHMQINSLIY